MSTTDAEHNQNAGNVATEERSTDAATVAEGEICPTCNQKMPRHVRTAQPGLDSPPCLGGRIHQGRH